jgi:hypothetical protein
MTSVIINAIIDGIAVWITRQFSAISLARCR